jgi:hypothetical protein
MVIAGAGAGIFDKLEQGPHKNGPSPQHCVLHKQRKAVRILSYMLNLTYHSVPVPVFMKKIES